MVSPVLVQTSTFGTSTGSIPQLLVRHVAVALFDSNRFDLWYRMPFSVHARVSVHLLISADTTDTTDATSHASR
jgi:hypothetical protein